MVTAVVTLVVGFVLGVKKDVIMAAIKGVFTKKDDEVPPAA